RQVRELLRGGEIGEVSRVVWHTLRTRPAPAGDTPSQNWRLEPAVACGGILADHGWHAFYVVQRWIGKRPTSIAGRRRRRASRGSGSARPRSPPGSRRAGTRTGLSRTPRPSC